MRPSETREGTVGNPIRCADWSEAYDAAVERRRPVVVLVPDYTDGSATLALCFPSRTDKVLRRIRPGGAT